MNKRPDHLFKTTETTMTFLLKQIFSFLRLLNSDTGHNQIAAGIACGLILGFAPFFSLQTFLVIFLLFFFRIQMGAATVSAFFFAFAAWILDPLHDSVGRAVLEHEPLRPLFTDMYNMPLVPLTRFYNSIVMGSGLVSIVLAIPMFFLARFLVLKYRVTVAAKFKETKLWKAIKATSFYNWYLKYEELY
jgi:uncharacterized protein (TIGR03546 family)